jgi:hypothetical protein
VVAHAFNPSTWETEAGGFLSSRPPGLQSEFQDSQGYTEKTCLKKTKTKEKEKKEEEGRGGEGRGEERRGGERRGEERKGKERKGVIS